MTRSAMVRLVLVLGLAALAALVASPIAIAADGEGLYGRTDDKVITFFAFGVIGFFAVLVIVLSLIQIRLESRKERLHRDLQRFGR
jgi:putative copper export protein